MIYVYIIYMMIYIYIYMYIYDIYIYFIYTHLNIDKKTLFHSISAEVGKGQAERWGLQKTDVTSRSHRIHVWYMGVSKNRGGFYPPKSSHLFIGFGTILFTIHFGGVKSPYFWVDTYICLLIDP